MALIVEVVDRAGAVQTRLRLGGTPLTIGRGYDNDLILDDLYVDARHARIHVAEDGSIVVEDLGSINGLVVVDDAAHAMRATREPRIAVAPGTQVKVGRTVLRFRDPAEPVPPALIEVVKGSRVEAFLDSVWGRVIVSVAAVALVALFTWLTEYDRETTTTTMSVAIGYVALVAIWCGIWAIASRVVIQRFNFMGHYAVCSAVTVAALLLYWVQSWVTFMFPDSALIAPVDLVIWMLLVTAAVAFQLRLASHMNRFRRWRAAAVTTGIIAAMVGLMALAESDTFTDVPEFQGMLKPISPRLLPTSSVADYADVVAELKREVDDLAGE